jgi:UDPglucose 6-dehydrogenase
MAKITVAGIGYVGLANAVLLSGKNSVHIFDISEEKRNLLKKGISPIKDAEIEDYLQNKKLDITVSENKEDAYKDADFVIIATQTDYDDKTNFFNTSSVESVVSDVEQFSPSSTIVIKSTIPIGFTESCRKKHPKLNILFSPEFLREGRALYDNLYPSRIIVGDVTEKAREFGKLVLEAAIKKDAPLFFMQSTEAEAVKLFANTFLALRVAYFNELDTFAEIKGLDSASIIEGVCLDPRIGNQYNNPSFGYGGYCLPKDTRQLKANYSEIPNNLITAIVEANITRKNHIAEMIIKKSPKVVGIYKLAMKSESDNWRASAVLDIIKILKTKKIEVIIYDPILSDATIYDCTIIQQLSDFIEKSDIIIANRITNEIKSVESKIYTRDIFTRD